MLEFALAKKYCKTVEEKLIFLFLAKTYGIYSPIDDISSSLGVPNTIVTDSLRHMVGAGYVERRQLNPQTAEGPLYGYGVKP